MAGPDLDAGPEREEALVKRREELRRSPTGIDREIRAGDVADEQRVPGQDRDRIAAAGRVAEQERGVLGPVTGRVHRLDPKLTELQGPAVVDRVVGVLAPARRWTWIVAPVARASRPWPET